MCAGTQQLKYGGFKNDAGSRFVVGFFIIALVGNNLNFWAYKNNIFTGFMVGTFYS